MKGIGERRKAETYFRYPCLTGKHSGGLLVVWQCREVVAAMAAGHKDPPSHAPAAPIRLAARPDNSSAA
jgi:hypothetical protein